MRVAAPVVALLYVMGTSAILAFVSPDAVDVIGPIPQALSLGGGAFGIAKMIAPMAILLLLANLFRQLQLELWREFAATDGGRMGSSAAGMVHAAASET